MSKPTPGPWEWDGRWLHGNGSILLWYTSADNGVHCGEANARLIAAAPELLEALQAICDQSDRLRAGGVPREPEPERLYQKARAAIAKATGGAA